LVCFYSYSKAQDLVRSQPPGYGPPPSSSYDQQNFKRNLSPEAFISKNSAFKVYTNQTSTQESLNEKVPSSNKADVPNFYVVPALRTADYRSSSSVLDTGCRIFNETAQPTKENYSSMIQSSANHTSSVDQTETVEQRIRAHLDRSRVLTENASNAMNDKAKEAAIGRSLGRGTILTENAYTMINKAKEAAIGRSLGRGTILTENAYTMINKAKEAAIGVHQSRAERVPVAPLATGTEYTSQPKNDFGDSQNISIGRGKCHTCHR
jgi:hypothetical protein